MLLLNILPGDFLPVVPLKNVSTEWSGRPGSNRRHPAWEAGVLPLNYSRSNLRRRLSLSPPETTLNRRPARVMFQLEIQNLFRVGAIPTGASFQTEGGISHSRRQGG